MSPDTWITFVAVSTLLLLTPGPVAALAVSCTMTLGRERTWMLVPGAMLGDLCAMLAALAGVSVLLVQWPDAFIVLKLAGAAVLIWLGLSMTLSPSGPDPETAGFRSPAHVFWSGFAVTALHPAGFVFFTAFVPQFIDPAGPAAPQFVTMSVTFLTLAGLTTCLWIILADRARGWLQNRGTRRLLPHLSGVLLMGFGAASAVFAPYA